jgi:hypothetical protein
VTGDTDHTTTADRALLRMCAEIVDGLRHRYFDFRVTCEVNGQGCRRLILHAGKIPGLSRLCPVNDFVTLSEALCRTCQSGRCHSAGDGNTQRRPA